VPPTALDIKAAQDDLWTKKYYTMEILKNGVPVNEAELKAQWQAESLTLGLKLKRATTKLHKMYVDKDAFTVNPAITPHEPPKVEDMWYAQMQLWMQRDLAYAIAEENAKSNTILDSPVKRLLKIDILASTGMYVFPPGAAAAQAGATPTPPAKDTDPIPLNYAVSATGRYSNGMYDVLQFTMAVDVDASKVNEFIETLSHQRLIAVNIQNEYALDSEAEARNSYLYGSRPTVRLVLDGEMLFMRSWTTELMPEKVKQALGLIPGGAPGGSPGGMGGGGMGGGGGMPVGPNGFGPGFHGQ
jgi:hypothetical protein